MTKQIGIITTATEADIDMLSAVKPNFGALQVRERFHWLSVDVEGTWFLLKLYDAVIGWCLVIWSGKKTHPRYPDMQDLYIKSEHRGCGHGTRMIREIERMAVERGYDRIGLTVNPDDNVPARRLYERLGYQHDGRERYIDGVYNGYEDWVIDLEKSLLV